MILAPTVESVARAAAALVSGRLVGMPTETVYGIAARALDDDAVRAVFAAKGRPAENPLIVHIADFARLGDVAKEIPEAAATLARRFWPGPLTMVLPKRPAVPDSVTGGLDTVAVRVPDHPVARALIEAADTPVAAPSANRFMGLSPTRAEHIDPSIAAALDCILDGGPCRVGIESTVVDLTERRARILRPGGVSAAALAAALGYAPGVASLEAGEVRRGPGMYARHYAPRTPVQLVSKVPAGYPGIVLGPPSGPDTVALPKDPEGYAAGLYAALHDLDRLGGEVIFVETPPDTPEWSAVWNRLTRAAG